ncbi:hypothetical protein MBLNU13_g09978t1 [Cladosporium sp. NU13]
MPPRRTKPKLTTPPPSPPTTPLPTPALTSTPLRMSYRIARGEQGVLTFEPYKSHLLPLWRFKTVPIARASCAALSAAFAGYVARGDFVGADMARKFIQMGMTRARRYANHKGGRKYDRSEREVLREGGERVELAKSEGHEGMEEKAEASEVFKRGWEACRKDEGYRELKAAFQKEQKEWDKAQKGTGVTVEDGKGTSVKEEKGVQEEGMVKEESDQG